jgi:hypothetical protein
MLRALSLICALAAAGIIAFAMYQALVPLAVQDPPFVIASADYDLGIASLGDRTIAFTVSNPAVYPRRIIGVAEG